MRKQLYGTTVSFSLLCNYIPSDHAIIPASYFIVNTRYTSNENLIYQNSPSISLSQSGFIFLQCPHQGARNFTKTVFPEVSASQLSALSSMALAPVAAAANPRNRAVNFMVEVSIG